MQEGFGESMNMIRVPCDFRKWEYISYAAVTSTCDESLSGVGGMKVVICDNKLCKRNLT